MFLTASNLMPYLIGRRVVSPESVVDGEFVVSEVFHRNRNFKVIRRGHSGLFIKQVRALEPPLVMSLAREAACMRLIGSLPAYAALSRLIPRLIDYDPAHQTLIIELFSNGENLTEYHQRLVELPPGVARLIGNGLGTCHSNVGRRFGSDADWAAFPGQLPAVLSPHFLGSGGLGHVRNAAAQLLEWMRHCPELPRRLDELRSEWRQECLMHGDMKWDNCLVIQGEKDNLELRIVDWEHADYGDACWDVAGVIQSYIVHGITSLMLGPKATPDQLGSQSIRELEPMRPALREFWNTYISVRELGAASACRIRDQSVRYAAARLVQSAFEHANVSDQLPPAAVTMLRLSLSILSDPREAAARLFGC